MQMSGRMTSRIGDIEKPALTVLGSHLALLDFIGFRTKAPVPIAAPGPSELF